MFDVPLSSPSYLSKPLLARKPACKENVSIFQDEKSFHVMKFNNSMKMDFADWTQVCIGQNHLKGEFTNF